MDEVFKALADPNRRLLLDRLNARNGQSLRELGEGLAMARQSVSKHLAVLEEANLVMTRWQGREKLYFLNPVPIHAIADRWMTRYDQRRVTALADLKSALEELPVASEAFVYTTFIRTTPELAFRALTEPAFTREYWGGTALIPDWKVGSPLSWQSGDEAPVDMGQTVLEYDPPSRLAYTWHHFQPEHAQFFGWSEERFAELAKEPRSRVLFEIERTESGVKLTIRHDGFEPGSVMRQAISGGLAPSGGWPEVLSDLKTLLEGSSAA